MNHTIDCVFLICAVVSFPLMIFFSVCALAGKEARKRMLYDAVRGFRKTPRIRQIALAFAACVVIMYGGSKPTMNPASQSKPSPVSARQQTSFGKSSAPLYAAPVPRTNSIVPVPGFYPEWWQGEDACTADDGIPDQWKRRTHSIRYAPDDDPDGDGLTNLQEFWLCTDPRRARTMGGVFTDSELVAMGRDPLAPVDFTPNENPNLWAGSYYGPYTTTNSEGFVTWYASGFPPPDNDSALVWVDVKTSRSAALDYGGGGIIFPAGQYTVKLCISAYNDTRLRLLAYPDTFAETPPQLYGELWVAKMETRFAPVAAQRTQGNALILYGGDLSGDDHFDSVGCLFKTNVCATIATCFMPDAPAPAPAPAFAPQSRTPQETSGDNGGDGGRGASESPPNPETGFTFKGFSIVTDDPGWHGGAVFGPTVATNMNGVAVSDLIWSSPHGEIAFMHNNNDRRIMSLKNAGATFFDDYKIKITCRAELDTQTAITNQIAVSRCSVQPLTAKTGDEFATALESSHGIEITLPNCPHIFEPGYWVETEVMRETTAGWQHVDWVDASPAQPGRQKRVQIFGATHNMYWQADAGESAALAESPAIFTSGKEPFRRALPAVISGEPYPPPYYTLFTRIRSENSDSSPVIESVKNDVYVPQVVKVTVEDAAVAEFNKPIVFPDTFFPAKIGDIDVNNGVSEVLYQGANMTKAQLTDAIVSLEQSKVPQGVNLHFVTKTRSNAGIKHIGVYYNYNPANKNIYDVGGRTPIEHVSWRNEKPYGYCDVYIYNIRKEVCVKKLMAENAGKIIHSYSPDIFPLSPDDFIKALSFTGIHEVGHTLGLVDKIIWGANYHDPSSGRVEGQPFEPNLNRIMNPLEPIKFLFDKVPGNPRVWRVLDADYLRFILPKPPQK